VVVVVVVPVVWSVYSKYQPFLVELLKYDGILLNKCAFHKRKGVWGAGS